MWDAVGLPSEKDAGEAEPARETPRETAQGSMGMPGRA